MDKYIKYRQKVAVIEHYEIEYTYHDFQCDCEACKIENITFEEVCDILSGNAVDQLIYVTESYIDDDGNFLFGPHIVSAHEFFNRMVCDSAFEYGYDDRDEIEILERKITILQD